MNCIKGISQIEASIDSQNNYLSHVVLLSDNI